MKAPYRNDHDALMTRLTGLMDELAGIRSRASQLRDLERTEHDVEREIAEVRREVARVAPTRLPLLDRVAIASPCPADWNAMVGDDRARFCSQCEKHVYNIASMTSEEAEAFLRGAGGEACLRLYRRPDGTVLTSDCPVGVRRKRRRRAIASLVGGTMVSAGAMLAFQRTRPAPPDVAVRVITAAPSGSETELPTSYTDAPSAMPTTTQHVPVPAGIPAHIPREVRLESELANIRALLDQRARTKDPAKRRALEVQIRAASQAVVALSPSSP
jgi:hypothetical protein